MSTFDMQDTFAKIVDIVGSKLDIDKKTITANSTFQDLGADSLDLLEIIMRLEEQFGIEINDEDAEKIIFSSACLVRADLAHSQQTCGDKHLQHGVVPFDRQQVVRRTVLMNLPQGGLIGGQGVGLALSCVVVDSTDHHRSGARGRRGVAR